LRSSYEFPVAKYLRVAVNLSSALTEFLIFVVCFEILFLTNSNKDLYVSLSILRYFFKSWVHFRVIVVAISYENTNFSLKTNSCTASFFSLFFLLLDRQVIALSQELQQLFFFENTGGMMTHVQDSHSVYHYPR
jgi:hypothetical protein